MLLPIGTDARTRRQPLVTAAIVAANLAVFVLQRTLSTRTGDAWVAAGQLTPLDFHAANLLTYQFLHADFWHVAGNMIFLWPFGRTIEDRFGHIGFAVFFLGCGAIAGLAHMWSTPAPVIGASGAVCAVTAAFVAIAPRMRIRVLLIFFVIGVYSIPALWLVGLFVLFDGANLLGSLIEAGGDRVAWVAHLAGYASGFTITAGLLLTGLIPRGDPDLFRLLRQSRRRAEYRRTIKGTQRSRVLAEDTAMHTVVLKPRTPRMSDSVSAGRGVVARLAASGDLETAAARYLELLDEDDTLAMDASTQVEIGNWLVRHERFEEAATVYEQHIARNLAAEDRSDVALLLCTHYIRRLDKPQRAHDLLEEFAQTMAEAHPVLFKSVQSEVEKAMNT